jgi:hypothetical protein
VPLHPGTSCDLRASNFSQTCARAFSPPVVAPFRGGVLHHARTLEARGEVPLIASVDVSRLPCEQFPEVEAAVEAAAEAAVDAAVEAGGAGDVVEAALEPGPALVPIRPASSYFF